MCFSAEDPSVSKKPRADADTEDSTSQGVTEDDYHASSEPEVDVQEGDQTESTQQHGESDDVILVESDGDDGDTAEQEVKII